ncbi:hypothetical protein CAPTEDRAFT_209444 [Capitella teleta]|uniref:Uncharacterized protein n=1 Tax=Capitella teleta TaxID=283909 RepID=R7ULM7_CAPTE|nr:hypothetical protein CAPTEDRAFT_209444 [Capitella teleta]|eukprot:ELU07444.1 hypothetical protein CAPTEDRAFT_209444 [Capitella teleta]
MGSSPKAIEAGFNTLVINAISGFDQQSCLILWILPLRNVLFYRELLLESVNLFQASCVHWSSKVAVFAAWVEEVPFQLSTSTKEVDRSGVKHNENLPSSQPGFSV